MPENGIGWPARSRWALDGLTGTTPDAQAWPASSRAARLDGEVDHQVLPGLQGVGQGGQVRDHVVRLAHRAGHMGDGRVHRGRVMDRDRADAFHPLSVLVTVTGTS